jgi:hypothetical protein
MITLFLKAHSVHPIYLTINLTSENQIHSVEKGLTIPAVGSYHEISFSNFKAYFSIGKVVARDDRICIYSCENERVTLIHNDQIVPWLESGSSHILTLPNHHT